MARYDGSLKFDTSIDSKGFNTGIKGIVSSLKAVGVAIAGAFVTKQIIDCTKEAEKYQNALTGLKSIMDGQGRSFSTAQKFIQSYTEDGLIAQTEAITAYKNLALRGYDTSQIEKVMVALKDSATYSRQASYGLGEAVATAAEGLKNENSVVVDNAGVTKNVAKMWEEYAKSIGKTTNNLTQAEKIQAEVNGILEETKFQTGDAATYANSYSGMIARLKASFTTLKQTIGGAFMQIFQAVLPVIQAVINALIKLANIFAQVVSLIFNKQVNTNKDLAKSSKSATSGIKKQGDAAEKAGKQAEGALLSFDKLEVLDDKSSSSSGGGSTIDTGSGASIPDPIGNLELGNNVTISPKIQEMIDKLKNINFEPLIASFENLKKAAQPLIDNIGQALLWFYDNVLVPLAKYTIEDLLPAFLDVLAGTIKVLNQLLEAFKPIFMWFWDNFLQPIAQWTGGIIVDVLNAVADALDKIGNWMSDNQSTVTNMEIAVLGFFGAWKVIELMSFIQQSGGLITALKLMTTTLWKCIAAKIADKAETIALTLMYAKDFIVSIAQGTAALVKQAAQWVKNTALKIADVAITVTMTAVTTAATVATWLFNAALTVLTSPITLVIIAIGLLIAAIVLCIKHWDEIKETVSIVWENIKTKVSEVVETVKQKIGEWIENLKQKFEELKNNVSTIFTNIKNTAVNIWNNITTSISSIVTNIKNHISNTLNNIKTIWNSIFNSIKTTTSNIFNGIWSTIKRIINSILGGIEGMANGIVRGVNTVINAMNGLSFDIPEWVPGMGGNKFGFNIPNLNNISLPRLATGAVIPPRQEFMAVLGDQRNGRNLEAPENLIRQIVREESGNKKVTIITKLVVDKRELAEIIKEVNLDEEITSPDLDGGGAFVY